MTSEELQTARAARWAELRPVEVSAANLRAWARAAGFLDPPEMAAWSGAALEMLEPELAAGHLVELVLWPGRLRYTSHELLHFIYAAVGDRDPRRDFQTQARERRLSWLAAEVYELLLSGSIASSGPGTSAQLRDRLGAERTSVLTVEAALRELAATLKVVRVGRGQDGEARWRPLLQVMPGVPRQAKALSLVEAAAALASKWLDVNVCGTEEELAAFYAPLFSRTRIHAALSGLEAMRQVEMDSIEGRQAYRLRQR